MIRSINNTDKINALNPFGIRIKALHNAYGGTNICSFYVDTDTSCIMAKSGSVLILDGSNTSDNQLLFDFCKLLGVNRLLCSSEHTFSKEHKTEGYILKHNASKTNLHNKRTVINDKLRDIFPLIKNNLGESLSGVSFDEFYVDLSHKVRHGCAAASIVYDECNQPVSCAVAPFVCNEGAVISAVCTNKEIRNNGYASSAVNAIIDHLTACGVDKIFLQISNIKLLDLYNRLGFVCSGKWQEILL
ncbi:MULTISPECIES: GNAT family N-acetyltransferase [unclassified Ruminococcus]|uniref:GNAT family N-acetyltransferase n=1 Tax=unclassified Ruminococcus TaxID=2608920 RepID=UPI00210C3539|nr:MULTISPECIES: GNAT family N-acetyltransferase [unclassified Ruminococcus]MCQ4022046.1 GNAT family N-acetyltransferase [Ruminococcus sp. zg-924]MCQ4114366.1 GNAT family N-acetyltransferase [Ruminococcus sp. zg-921]